MLEQIPLVQFFRTTRQIKHSNLTMHYTHILSSKVLSSLHLPHSYLLKTLEVGRDLPPLRNLLIYFQIKIVRFFRLWSSEAVFSHLEPTQEKQTLNLGSSSHDLSVLLHLTLWPLLESYFSINLYVILSVDSKHFRQMV